jgi:hypothetical protein
MHPCDICGKTSHVWFNCPLRDTKPKDWKPERLLTKSTAPLESRTRRIGSAKESPTVDTAPKPKRGRPKTITDMAAYKAAKQREYRARSKASKPIK